MVPDPSESASHVVVVAANTETMQALREYLKGAGVASRTTPELMNTSLAARSTRAIVIFPDEFEADEVVNRVSSLRAARPQLLLVLITGTPARYRAALEPEVGSVPPVVLPKPAFGWSIVDVVRAQLVRADDA